MEKREDYIQLNGCLYEVLSTVQGEVVELHQVKKTEIVQEGEVGGLGEDVSQNTPVTEEEKEAIKKIVLERNEEEKKQDIDYRDVSDITEKTDYSLKLQKHVSPGQEGFNEFRDRYGPDLGVETKEDFRAHMVETLEDSRTSCFLGQAYGNRNAILAYNKDTNTFIAVPSQADESTTMFRPKRGEYHYLKKLQIDTVAAGKSPKQGKGIYELLPHLEKDKERHAQLADIESSREEFLNLDVNTPKDLAKKNELKAELIQKHDSYLAKHCANCSEGYIEKRKERFLEDLKEEMKRKKESDQEAASRASDLGRTEDKDFSR